MGWASGSELFEWVWEDVRPFLPTQERTKVAVNLIKAFEAFDCDTLSEIVYGHEKDWPELSDAMDLIDREMTGH